MTECAIRSISIGTTKRIVWIREDYNALTKVELDEQKNARLTRAIFAGSRGIKIRAVNGDNNEFKNWIPVSFLHF